MTKVIMITKMTLLEKVISLLKWLVFKHLKWISSLDKKINRILLTNLGNDKAELREQYSDIAEGAVDLFQIATDRNRLAKDN